MLINFGAPPLNAAKNSWQGFNARNHIPPIQIHFRPQSWSNCPAMFGSKWIDFEWRGKIATSTRGFRPRAEFTCQR